MTTKTTKEAGIAVKKAMPTTKVAKKKILTKKAVKATKSVVKGPAELWEAVEQLKKALGMHGGSIEIVGFDGVICRVHLTGACAGCPLASVTLKETVEKYLLAKVPGLKKVEAV